MPLNRFLLEKEKQRTPHIKQDIEMVKQKDLPRFTRRTLDRRGCGVEMLSTKEAARPLVKMP
jgi:hypothetical protein